VAGISPQASTKTLARALTKAFPTWSWQIKNTDSYWYSCALAIISPDGSLVAADATAWLHEQIALHGSGRVLDRIKTEDVRFARTGGDTGFYALGYKPDEPLDFVQIYFRPTSRMVYSFPTIQPLHLERSPDRWDSYWTLTERSPPVYSCEATDIIGSLAWLDKCKAAQRESGERDLALMQAKVVTRTYLDGSHSVTVPFLEAFPLPGGRRQAPAKEERFFADWRASSAGTHPLGRFWFLATFDYVDRDGLREVGFIPQAVVWPRKTVEAKRKSVWRLMDELQRFDRTVGHPFAWYFYMLHGNRISRDVGEAIAHAVRRGDLHLNPNEEAVLLAWADEPYGF
jgi:hypothetical protein